MLKLPLRKIGATSTLTLLFCRTLQDQVNDPQTQKHLWAEFIGTGLFTYLAGAAAVNGEAAGLLTGAMGSGLALAVMIYATCGISKGRLNPAVSLGYYVAGRETQNIVILEVAAQFLGGFAGGLMLKLSLPHTDLTVPLVAMGGPSYAHPLATFIWEFLSTAFLVYTVFAMCEDNKVAESELKKEFGPLVIGLVVVVCAFAAGPFSGAAMNPARALGPSLAFWNFKNIWVYLFATFLGGVAGAVVYEATFLQDQPPTLEEGGEDNGHTEAKL